MSKPNVTVHHSGSKDRKEISVGSCSWGFALKVGASWGIYKNVGVHVATADSFRGIEFAVLGVL